jgi:hypothetical protein
VAAVSRPAVRFDRHGAVGWRDIALDGLNCYLRGIEAILRAAGYTLDDVVEEMGGAITDRFEQDGKAFVRLNRCETRWSIAPPGLHRWAVVEACVSAGEPVVIWPDGFYWPGGRFEGRRHIHNHAVLAVGFEGGSLHCLDIDAADADGYQAAVPVTDDTKRACTRILRVDVVAPARRLRASAMDRLIGASIRPLTRLARATAAYASWWAVNPRRRLATSLDIWALSDVQPQLFLFSCICRRFGYDALATRSIAAATQAKKVSLFVDALNQCRPVAPYDLCGDDIALLAERLAAVEHAAREAVGRPPAVADDGRAGAWLWRRLNALSVWHLGVGLGCTMHSHMANVSAAYVGGRG